jgi:hypothetical protein
VFAPSRVFIVPSCAARAPRSAASVAHAQSAYHPIARRRVASRRARIASRCPANARCVAHSKPHSSSPRVDARAPS